ncbi:Mss4-like protein [Lineolata rhizophorae]|uniref:Mss4-like protein n=1 Tax=Lineolata rhizophorae TaxID=578093 RepID=A0A6A6PDM5_9PEZI|nr:Mss4-like protein [Lineolata rhizophorae]
MVARILRNCALASPSARPAIGPFSRAEFSPLLSPSSRLTSSAKQDHRLPSPSNRPALTSRAANPISCHQTREFRASPTMANSSSEPSKDAASRVRHGKCLCGSVKMTVSGEPRLVALCYCSHCRANSGGVAQVGAVFPASQCPVDDPENLLRSWVHEDTKSGFPKNKFFCSRCGCHCYNEAGDPKGERRWSVRAVLFEGGLDDLSPSVEVFTENKPGFIESSLESAQIKSMR